MGHAARAVFQTGRHELHGHCVRSSGKTRRAVTAQQAGHDIRRTVGVLYGEVQSDRSRQFNDCARACMELGAPAEPSGSVHSKSGAVCESQEHMYTASKETVYTASQKSVHTALQANLHIEIHSKMCTSKHLFSWTRLRCSSVSKADSSSNIGLRPCSLVTKKDAKGTSSKIPSYRAFPTTSPRNSSSPMPLGTLDAAGWG